MRQLLGEEDQLSDSQEDVEERGGGHGSSALQEAAEQDRGEVVRGRCGLSSNTGRTCQHELFRFRVTGFGCRVWD